MIDEQTGCRLQIIGCSEGRRFGLSAERSLSCGTSGRWIGYFDGHLIEIGFVQN